MESNGPARKLPCCGDNSIVPQTHQLFILRHAKSSWEDPGLEDRERPLAPRGHRAVEALADHIRENGIQPAQVLCSPARRTRETLHGLALKDGETLFEPELYSASCSSLIERLHQVPEELGSVMVVGHNPTMQMVILRLVGGNSSDGALFEAVQRKYPTGALATLEFEGSWSELAPGAASLAALVRPKDFH